MNISVTTIADRPALHRRALFALAGCLLAVSAVPASQTARADVHLTFGTYTADKPTATVRKFKPVLGALETALSQRLGEQVRISTQIAATYAAGIDDLVEQRVDFARFGPASYITAKQRHPGISLLAMEAISGRKTFNGVISVHTDSSLKTLADLRGRSFAFGSKLSTIGRYLSQQQLLAHDITASELSRFDYLGRHDRVGMAVASKEFDAGALKESTFRKLVRKSQPIKAIAKFPNVTKPWIARPGLPAKLSSALRSALLGLKDKKALGALKKSGFLAAADNDFDPIRQAIRDSARFGG